MPGSASITEDTIEQNRTGRVRDSKWPGPARCSGETEVLNGHHDLRESDTPFVGEQVSEGSGQYNLHPKKSPSPVMDDNPAVSNGQDNLPHKVIDKSRMGDFAMWFQEEYERGSAQMAREQDEWTQELLSMRSRVDSTARSSARSRPPPKQCARLGEGC
jgi:hypothetical protein